MVDREVPLVMPKMSMTMTEGTFLAWHKGPGDEVRAGDVVCEVTTDKVDMEVEATVDGTLTRLVARPEDVIPVGDPIAYVATTADDLLSDLFDAPPATEPPTNSELFAAPPARPKAGRVPGVAAVPAARRLAAERGIDLATVTPTGPWHTIRLSDVDTPGVEPRNGRAVIARRMSASAGIPQFVLFRDLDLERVRRTTGWTAVFVYAFAAALRRNPALNAQWIDGEPRPLSGVGVALAVDTARGLLAPVLTDPDLLELGALAERVADLVARARAGKLSLAELRAPAAATVSNLGGFGIESFQALVSPPQASVLSLGVAGPKAVPDGDVVAIRQRITAGLTVDHRVADGADAARLLADLQGILDDL